MNNLNKRYANLIIIGGTIAAGKSSLVEGISKYTGWNPIPELRDGDKVQEIILNKLYEGSRIHLATVQFYFLANRYRQYKEEAGGVVTSILDRGPWEDWFFAKLLMEPELKSYEHFKKLWKNTIEKILELFGYPMAYIYLKVDWENFKERIFNRGRASEVKNFNSNERYFKRLLKEYNEYFVSLLKEWDIKPIVLDTTTLNKEQVLEKTLEQLKEQGVI